MVVRIGDLSLVNIWSAGFDKLGLKREGGDQAYWCVWMGGVYVRARDPSVLTDGYETTVHSYLIQDLRCHVFRGATNRARTCWRLRGGGGDGMSHAKASSANAPIPGARTLTCKCTRTCICRSKHTHAHAHVQTDACTGSRPNTRTPSHP